MNAREKERAFREVMFSLAGNDHFQRYIEFLKEQREAAMLEASSDRVISDKRLLQTYLGTIRAYTEQIDHHASFLQQAEDIAAERAEG